MEILILILFVIVAFLIFAGFMSFLFNILPFLLIAYGVYYLYLRYIKNDRPQKSTIQEYQHKPNRDDVIDVEFTVHDEKED